MKIVADDRIPFLKGVLEPFADMVYLPGPGISNHDLRDADALLVRTRTNCNRELLENTPVKFVGTATIGYDHLDTRYLEEQGIVWRNAPGCNAGSVNQYIASVLAYLAGKHKFSLANRTLGVVGVGNVGSRVVRTAELLGMTVYLCDPPRVREEGLCGYISLEGILRECDIITFHVPLIYEGTDSTYHMIGNELLNRVNPGTFIINSSRGEVADDKALKKAIRTGKIAGAILDVWENEPDIDVDLLKMTTLGTPHIAGYSADGKANGTALIVNELSLFFDMGIDGWTPGEIPKPIMSDFQIDCRNISQEEALLLAILGTYDVEDDDSKLKKEPANFEKFRSEYHLRREFKAFTLELMGGTPQLGGICRKMGFRVVL